MADIYGSHFEYGGISSRRYGLIFVNVQTERFSQSSGKIDGVKVFNRKEKRIYLVDDNYSDSPISFDVDIISDNERGIEKTERREIEKWLFNKHDFKKLYLDITDDEFGETYEIIDGLQKQLYMNCRFVNPTRLEYNGGIVGYRVTLEADSGFWWQDAVKKSFTLDNTNIGAVSTVNVNVDTDIDDYTYPKVRFRTGEVGGNVIISNTTDSGSRITKFVELSPNIYVTLNGTTNYVSGDYYSKFSAQNFPRLLDGNNSITITGNIVAISFEFNNRRML